MSNPITVHPINVKDGTYEVTLRPDGTFVTTVRDKEVTSTSHKGLAAKVRKIVSDTPRQVEVPFSDVNGSRVCHGVATGIHAKDRRLLVRWDSGDCSQIGLYLVRDFVRRLTPEEESYLKGLMAQRDDLNQLILNFKLSHALDVENAVRLAMEKTE